MVTAGTPSAIGIFESVDEAVAQIDLSSWGTSAGFSMRPPAVMALEVAQMYRRIEAD